MGVQGLNPDGVGAAIGCTNCDWTYDLELRPGLPVSAMRQNCPHCNNPVHLNRLEVTREARSGLVQSKGSESVFGCGVKTLTKNDVSWLAAGSESHQDAINLPVTDFDEMFSDVRSEEPHRFTFEVHWHYFDGSEIEQTPCDVVWYESKKELRIAIKKASADVYSPLAREGTILVIKRRGDKLEIYAIKPPTDIRTPEPLHESEPRKSEDIVPGIANRASPFLACLKAASDAISSSGDDRNSITYEELLAWVINYGRACRDIMRNREQKEGTPRGRRISSGFPVSIDEFMEKERNKPRNRRSKSSYEEAKASESRWASTYLGYRTKGGELRGGLFELGMLDQEQGQGMIGLTVLGREVVTECMLTGIENENAGVRILDEWDASSFLLHLETYMPAEYSFIVEYARLLERGPLGNQDLIEHLCRSERRRVAGGGTPRWTNRQGVPWAELLPEEELPRKISPYLSGLHGRLWEMGFIEKDSSRKTTKYFLTEDGEQEILGRIHSS